MLDLAVFVVIAVVLPVVINKTTEGGHFHWIKPYLREIWTGILALGVLDLLLKPAPQDTMMKLHSTFPGMLGYVVAGVVGAALLCALWWTSGTMLKPSATLPHSSDLANRIKETAGHIEPPLTEQMIENAVRKALAKVGPPAPAPDLIQHSIGTEIGAIENDLSQKPKMELLNTAKELKRIVVQNLANNGMAIDDDPVKNIEALTHMGYIPSDWADAYKRFFALKNQLVNAMGTDQAEFTALNRWGTETLRLLRETQLSSHEVISADLQLYSDPDRMTQLPCVGVMLKEEQLGTGRVFGQQVFPTMKRGYYKPGQLVSWEWDKNVGWNKTWYRDEESGHIVNAFEQSLTFSGSNLKPILDKIK
jgi:hypothetical protein